MRVCPLPLTQLEHRPAVLAVAILAFAAGGFVERGSAAWGQVSTSPGSSTEPFTHAVLLLRNGHVVAGALVVEGDTYRVKVPDGELYLPRRSVLAVATSMRELYEQQKARLFGQDPEPHLELAIWCAEHGLAEEAQSELAQARALAPNHPGLGLATRRVEMALGRRAASADSSRLTGSGYRGGAKTSDLLGIAPGSPEPSSAPPLPSRARSPQPLPEVADPRILLRGLPEEAREEFVRVIQPIVSHNCASAACHGNPNLPESLRFYRLSPERHPSRGQTAQNLQTVLGWVNFSNPGASPLLTKPLQPHGGLPAPVFSGTDMKQYRDLVDWVYKITRQRTPPGPLQPTEMPTEAGTEALQAAAGIDLDTISPLPHQLEGGVQQAAFQAPDGIPGTPVVPATAVAPVQPALDGSPLVKSLSSQLVRETLPNLLNEPVRFPVGEFLEKASTPQLAGTSQNWPGESVLRSDNAFLRPQQTLGPTDPRKRQTEPSQGVLGNSRPEPSP